MAYIKGEWRWNDVIDFNLFAHYMNNYYYAYFTSNGEDFEEISMGIDLGGSVWIAYKRDGVAIYLSPQQNPGEMSTYVDEAYRTMDFGEAEQEIDDEFYEILTLVAAQILPIAKMLEIIAENEQKVFESGKRAGYIDGFQDGEIEGYRDGEADGYKQGMESSEAFEAGKKAEYDAFWDAIQQKGARTCYDYAFIRWGGEYIHPKYKVVPTESAKNVIYNCPDVLKVEAAYFDFSKMPYGTNANQSHAYNFATSRKLVEIEDVGLQPNFSYEYFACWDYELKKVACIRVDENTIVSNMLTGCYKLEDVTIEGTIGKSGINLSSSTLLSRTSIESFINALSDTATGQSITFSKVAVDREFRGVSPADFTTIVDGSHSLEWYNIVEIQKTNWTITLV